MTDWLAANYEPILRYGSIVIAWAAMAIAWGTAWTYRRMAKDATKTALKALDYADSLKRSQDPGREVQDRLAEAIAPSLIADTGPGDVGSRRRAIAMTLAANMMDVVQRANLEIVSKEEPDAQA